MCFIIRFATLFEARIETEKKHCVLKFNQSELLKPHVEFSIEKRIEEEKKSDKDRKAFYKLMENAVYGKKMEKLRNRIDVRLTSNEKDYLK